MAVNVCFSTADHWVSRLICWFSRAEVSHAALTFHDDTLDKTFIMEANGWGFMLVPWQKWKLKYKLHSRFSLKATEEDQGRSLRMLAEFLGSQYDYLSLVGFLWRRFLWRTRNPFNSPTKLVCSEAVAMFLYHAGHEKFRDFGSWTPGDLLAEIRKSAEFVCEETAKAKG